MKNDLRITGGTAKSKLADPNHPLVMQTATRLTGSATTNREKLARIFQFVRDQIQFGFPARGDFVPAYETIETGYGQCNTKATLFLALCRAAGIPARIHFSLISRDIQKGYFTGLAFRLMPKTISHSWIEVEIDGQWRRIDSFINDIALHKAAKQELAQRGWTVGYSLALSNGYASANLNVDTEAFSQMAAVTNDHGVWREPDDYYRSSLYRNHPGPLRRWLYRLVIGTVNRRVKRLRDQYRAAQPAFA